VKVSQTLLRSTNVKDPRLFVT